MIDLASRRVLILGSTPHPHEVFMQQVVRTMTAAGDGPLVQHRVLICDRDAKWSVPVRARLGGTSVQVVLTPRLVRSIKEECLNRLIPIGERHFRRAITAYVAHNHYERNHQGIENKLITSALVTSDVGRIGRRPRLGGLLNYYGRAA